MPDKLISTPTWYKKQPKPIRRKKCPTWLFPHRGKAAKSLRNVQKSVHFHRGASKCGGRRRSESCHPPASVSVSQTPTRVYIHLSIYCPVERATCLVAHTHTNHSTRGERGIPCVICGSARGKKAKQAERKTTCKTKTASTSSFLLL